MIDRSDLSDRVDVIVYVDAIGQVDVIDRVDVIDWPDVIDWLGVGMRWRVALVSGLGLLAGGVGVGWGTLPGQGLWSRLRLAGPEFGAPLGRPGSDGPRSASPVVPPL